MGGEGFFFLSVEELKATVAVQSQTIPRLVRQELSKGRRVSSWHHVSKHFHLRGLMNVERPLVSSAGGDPAQNEPNNSQTTQRSPVTGQLQSVPTTGVDLVQESQNTCVPMMTRAEKLEFKKFPNSTSFVIWKVNFQSEVCSSSNFPTEALVRINEIDSASMLDEYDSCNSFHGTKISRLRNNCQCSQEVADLDFRSRVHMAVQKHNTIDS